MHMSSGLIWMHGVWQNEPNVIITSSKKERGGSAIGLFSNALESRKLGAALSTGKFGVHRPEQVIQRVF